MYNNHPAYVVHDFTGVNQSGIGRWNWRGVTNTGPKLATFRWKHYARCTSPRAPFGYDETLQLLDAEDRPTLFADQKTLYRRNSTSSWQQYDVFTCKNTLRYTIHNELTGWGSTMMRWTVKDPKGDTLVLVEQPFTLWQPPDVYFKTPAGRTVAVLHQHWCTFCMSDDWSVLIETPGVVDASVFGYIAVLIKHQQLQDQSSSNSNSGSSSTDASAATI